MTRSWTGAGPEFQVEWGGRNWTLDVDDPRPGLRCTGDGPAPVGPLLGLEGVAAVGRWDEDALGGATRAGWERRFDRVEATYAPAAPEWGGLAVRAAWGPWGDSGIDLEIQVSAQSVDQLQAVEIKLRSALPEPPATRRKRWVEPRDARAATLSYDGRERDVHGWTTLPIPDDPDPGLAPRVLTGLFPGLAYAEFVLPHDAARRITETSKLAQLGQTTRYGLFGHDLEKGVVLRARLRGLWLPSQSALAAALEEQTRFLREPPPLGT